MLYTQNHKSMFGLFKKKSPQQALEEKYEKLMKEAFELSKVNRTQGDQKYAEAQKIMDQLDALKK